MSGSHPADEKLAEARALAARGALTEARKAAKACLKLRIGDPAALSLLDEIDARIEQGEQAAPQAPQALQWVVGARLLGEYTVEQQLGEGGMGVVFLVSRDGGLPFAVKTVLTSAIEGGRQAFFRELSTWISLPPHPNLLPCLFFRTVDDRIAIFTEYAPGGSLAGRIAERRLSHAAALDVAIQCAWGLEAAHQAGVVHQDVKPANVLLSTEGAMLSDFGLARAFSSRQGATRVGLSLPYCSPEQAAGARLGPASDQWSWAVMVLELYLGQPPCAFGPEAPAVLAAVERRERPTLWPMPGPVAAALRRCFEVDPGRRWPSMIEAAWQLEQGHAEVTGQPYDRPRPEPLGTRKQRYAERNHDGATWADPRRWLAQARGEAAPPQAPVEAFSREALFVDDIAIFDEAARLFGEQIRQGRAEQREPLGLLSKEQGFVHMAIGDLSGAQQVFERGLEALVPLVERREDLLRDVLVLLGNKAVIERARGELSRAIDTLHRATDLITAPVLARQPALARQLAMLHTNRATFLREGGRPAEAVRSVEHAVTLYELLIDRGDQTLFGQLGTVCNTGALLYQDAGELDRAVALFGRAIDSYDEAAKSGQRDEINNVAMACMNQAFVLRLRGDVEAAWQRAEQSINMRERLVFVEQRHEYLLDLALAYGGKAYLLSLGGDIAEEIQAHQQGLVILETLVHQQGRREHSPELATAYGNASEAAMRANDIQSALLLNSRAAGLLERLVFTEKRAANVVTMTTAMHNGVILRLRAGDAAAAVEMADRCLQWLDELRQAGHENVDLFSAYLCVSKADALLALGQRAEAQALAARAAVVFQAEIARTGRADLLPQLAHVNEVFGAQGGQPG